MIRPGDHRQHIDLLLDRYGLKPNSFAIVESVQRWCQGHGIEEDNPRRIAKCLCRRADGTWHVVMAAEICDDMIDSVKSLMLLQGFSEEVDSLEMDLDFLTHTVLHEIACHVLGVTEAKPRSKWAFEQLSRLPCG